MAARMLDEKGEPRDSRWWFTSSYVRTTEGAILEADSGSFTNPVFIFRLITYFEKLYYDNMTAADAGRPLEAHWRRAFDVAARADGRRNKYLPVPDGGSGLGGLRGVVASVVAASRAHIRFDLPRAMAWVHLTPSDRPDENDDPEFSSHIADFMAMAAVFERAARAANIDVARHTRLPVHLMPRPLQDWGMRFMFRADLIQERAYAWECAEALVSSHSVVANPYTEPEPGRLEGDVTTAASVDSFVCIADQLRPTMNRLRRAPVDGISRSRAVRRPASLNTVERIRALQGLCHGITGPADERAIIELLTASARTGDMVATVNGVGVYELAANLRGRRRHSLRTLLRTHYYPSVQPSIAVALLRRAILFGQLGWEDAMIADLICDRPDAPALLDLSGHDDQSGWQRIQHNLSRRSRSRILAAHPTGTLQGTRP